MNCLYVFQGCIDFVLPLPKRHAHQGKAVLEFKHGVTLDGLAALALVTLMPFPSIRL